MIHHHYAPHRVGRRVAVITSFRAFAPVSAFRLRIQTGFTTVASVSPGPHFRQGLISSCMTLREEFPQRRIIRSVIVFIMKAVIMLRIIYSEFA